MWYFGLATISDLLEKTIRLIMSGYWQHLNLEYGISTIIRPVHYHCLYTSYSIWLSSPLKLINTLPIGPSKLFILVIKDMSNTVLTP